VASTWLRRSLAWWAAASVARLRASRWRLSGTLSTRLSRVSETITRAVIQSPRSMPWMAAATTATVRARGTGTYGSVACNRLGAGSGMGAESARGTAAASPISKKPATQPVSSRLPEPKLPRLVR